MNNAPIVVQNISSQDILLVALTLGSVMTLVLGVVNTLLIMTLYSRKD